MRFDLTDLRLFLHVVETGSLTNGADASNMAPPSASARLRGMEERLGHPLLVRGRRGVEPTPAGDALAHHARLILRQVEEMHSDLRDFAQGARAQIAIMVNTAAISEFLPSALGSFLAEHRKIDITLKERKSADIVKAVAGGFADMGIVSDAVDTGGLHTHRVAVDRLVLAVAKDHPLAGQRRIRFDQVSPLPMIGLDTGSGLQDYLDERADAIGQRLTYRIRVRDFRGLCHLVAQGAGIAIIPEIAGKRHRPGSALALIRLSDRWATRHLLLVTRDPEALSPPARALFSRLAGR